MSLLDDLRRQTDALKAREEGERKRQEQLETIYREELLPKMEYIYTYLYELGEHLNYIKPDIVANYELQDHGKLGDLRQSTYKVVADSRRNMTRINFGFRCEAEGADAMEIIIEGKKNTDRYNDYLRRTGLKYNLAQIRDEFATVTHGVFTIERRVMVTFTFIANIAESCIDLTIRNFNSFESFKRQIQPSQITEAYMEDLGRFVIREQSQFLRLDISEAHRRRIQALLHEEAARREAELAQLDAAVEMEKANEDAGKRGKLLRMFQDLGKRHKTEPADEG